MMQMMSFSLGGGLPWIWEKSKSLFDTKVTVTVDGDQEPDLYRLLLESLVRTNLDERCHQFQWISSNKENPVGRSEKSVKPILVPGEGHLEVKHNGVTIAADHLLSGSAGSTGTSQGQKKLILQVPVAQKRELDNFLNQEWFRYSQRLSNKVFVYGSMECGWALLCKKEKRGLSSMVLDDNALSAICGIRNFFAPETKEKYAKLNVPYHRGYLLYGPPGNGKSSFVHVVASEFDLHVYYVKLSGIEDDRLLQILLSTVPPNSIILIEDIDCDSPTAVARVKENPSSGPTLSGMLNCLDGLVSSCESKLIMITTNKIGNLDPALVRPGRVDEKIEFKYPDGRMAGQLLRKFFPNTPAEEITWFENTFDKIQDSLSKREDGGGSEDSQKLLPVSLAALQEDLQNLLFLSIEGKLDALGSTPFKRESWLKKSKLYPLLPPKN